MLFIEYDVLPDGEIELVALVSAVANDGRDPDGAAWMKWRTAEFDDHGLGCVGVDDVLTSRPIEAPGGRLRLSEMLDVLPVAVLEEAA